MRSLLHSTALLALTDVTMKAGAMQHNVEARVQESKHFLDTAKSPLPSKFDINHKTDASKLLPFPGAGLREPTVRVAPAPRDERKTICPPRSHPPPPPPLRQRRAQQLQHSDTDTRAPITVRVLDAEHHETPLPVWVLLGVLVVAAIILLAVLAGHGFNESGWGQTKPVTPPTTHNPVVAPPACDQLSFDHHWPTTTGLDHAPIPIIPVPVEGVYVNQLNVYAMAKLKDLYPAKYELVVTHLDPVLLSQWINYMEAYTNYYRGMGWSTVPANNPDYAVYTNFGKPASPPTPKEPKE